MGPTTMYTIICHIYLTYILSWSSASTSKIITGVQVIYSNDFFHSVQTKLCLWLYAPKLSDCKRYSRSMVCTVQYLAMQTKSDYRELNLYTRVLIDMLPRAAYVTCQTIQLSEVYMSGFYLYNVIAGVHGVLFWPSDLHRWSPFILL